MDISFFRSSSYNCFNLCQHQYFMSYVLGWPQKVGKAATKGTIVHKTLEILAKAKLCEQDGVSSGFEDDIGDFEIKNFRDDDFVDYAHHKSFEYYKKLEQEDFGQAEERETRRWVQKVLDDGFYDPRKLDIIYPEKKFDFPIEQKWARLTNGEYLRVKGTIDLTIKSGNFYEVVDWKTGARKDWKTGEYKTGSDLDDDFQLRLYHYAVSKLYPEIETILVTINYINDGGAYTVVHGPENIEITEARIHDQLVRIKNCTHPRLKDNGKHWFCKRVCSYGKNNYRSSGKTECQYAASYLKYNGITQASADLKTKGFKIDHYEEPG